MGTGYAGAALTVIAIVVALGWSSWYKEEKIFWTIYAVIPLLLVPAADAYFGYFLAARQMIFVLVPISILIVACMEVRRWGLVVPTGVARGHGVRGRSLDPAAGRRLAGSRGAIEGGGLLDIRSERLSGHVSLLRTPTPRLR